MSLYSYEPFFSFNDVFRLFDDASSRNRQLQRTSSGERSLAQGFTPKMDVHEAPEENRVTATFELPGLTKDNVSIDVQNGRLIVSGERTTSKDFEDKGFVHRERQYGRFSRTLPLPSGTKPDEVQAKLENGLLTVTFPKASAEQAAQRITIS